MCTPRLIRHQNIALMLRTQQSRSDEKSTRWSGREAGAQCSEWGVTHFLDVSVNMPHSFAAIATCRKYSCATSASSSTAHHLYGVGDSDFVSRCVCILCIWCQSITCSCLATVEHMVYDHMRHMCVSCQNDDDKPTIPVHDVAYLRVDWGCIQSVGYNRPHTPLCHIYTGCYSWVLVHRYWTLSSSTSTLSLMPYVCRTYDWHCVACSALPPIDDGRSALMSTLSRLNTSRLEYVMYCVPNQTISREIHLLN